MALETFKGVESIGGFRVCDSTKICERMDKDQVIKELSDAHIVVNHDFNAITFRIQNGPTKEAGVNGCQVDTMIEAAKHIISELNKRFPCSENTCALDALNQAIWWLNERKKSREKRGVEGTSQA